MSVVVATLVGLIIWLVLWALGAKALDAFFIPLLLVLATFSARLIRPHLPGNRD